MLGDISLNVPFLAPSSSKYSGAIFHSNKTLNLAVQKSSDFQFLWTLSDINIDVYFLPIRLASTFAYHGLNLNSVRLTGNPYLNLFLTGGIEIPAIIVAMTVSIK